MAATVFAVGKSVVQVKDAPNFAIGWRTFDIRSNFYDIETRLRKSFILRCFLPDHPRWQKFPLPESDDVVQVSGKLVGRLANADTRLQYLCCRLEDFSILCSTPRSNQSGQVPVTPKFQKGETFNEDISSGLSQLTWSGRAHAAKQNNLRKLPSSLTISDTPSSPTPQKHQLGETNFDHVNSPDKALTPPKRRKTQVIGTGSTNIKDQQTPIPKRSSRIRQPTQKALTLTKGKTIASGSTNKISELEGQESDSGQSVSDV